MVRESEEQAELDALQADLACEAVRSTPAAANKDRA